MSYIRLMDRGKVEVRPITIEDSEAVCRFLHEQLNPRVPIAAWNALLEPPWDAEAPNHGFQLAVGSTIVGVYVAVYSQRVVDGVRRRFCNLAAFCVQDDYRSHSVRLMRAILAQREFEFTDLSPSGNVVALNKRLGFVALDTETRLVLNLPRARRGVTVSADPTIAATVLQGRDADAYRDHRDAPAARHIVVVEGARYGYLVVRKDRRKGLPIFASVLYAGGSIELLESSWPQIASHLLVRQRALATLAERRILGFIPAGMGLELAAPRAKMFRSREVADTAIDYLYSELALLEW